MRSALVILVLIAIGSEARAQQALKAWEQGVTLEKGEGVQERRLPNGLVKRFRLLKNGNLELLEDGEPAPVKLTASSFPERRRLAGLVPSATDDSPLGAFVRAADAAYEEVIARDNAGVVAELLDKVLRAPASASTLVVPPWESAGLVSARVVARARLLALPPEGKAAWRRLRDADGQPRIAAAVATGEPREIEEAVDLFPLATGAARALVFAGELWFERGELRAAQRLFERARDEYPDEIPSLAARIDRVRVLRTLAPAKPRSLARKELRTLWKRPIVGPPRALRPKLPSIVPAVAHDGAFVQDEDGASAIDLETGRLLWHTSLPQLAPLFLEEGNATVTLGELAVVVRARRAVFGLERSTGRVLARCDVEALGDERASIDAATSEGGRLYVVARSSGTRVVAAFDARGNVFRTELWPTSSADATILVGHEGLFVQADGGLASLERTGCIRWVRSTHGLDRGRGATRVLELRGDRLIQVERAGTLLVSPENGARSGLPPIRPEKSLARAVGDDGPIFLNPTPPRGDPMVLVCTDANVLIAGRLDKASLPVWSGIVLGETLFLPAEEALVALDLSSGEMVKVPCAPGRLAGSGDVVVVARDDELVAFAPRPPLAEPRALPAKLDDLVAALGADDWRVRSQARTKLDELASTSPDEVRRALEDKLANPFGDPDVREAGIIIFRELAAKEAWRTALPGAREITDKLSSRKPAERRRGVLDLATKIASGPPAPVLVELRRMVDADPEREVRLEALTVLATHDEKARVSIAKILFGEGGGRDTAARVVVNGGAAKVDVPAHAFIKEGLASPSEDVRASIYRALLEHGGPREMEIIRERAIPRELKKGEKPTLDGIAIREWEAHHARAARPPAIAAAQRPGEVAAREADETSFLDRFRWD